MMYAKAAVSGLVTGLLTPIVVSLITLLVSMVGVVFSEEGGMASGSFVLWPLSPLFAAGFLVGFVGMLLREKRRVR